MYAHQVIDDISKLSKIPIYDCQKIQNSISTIRSAHKFHFGDATGMVNLLSCNKTFYAFHDESLEYINPPFKNCWFDFHIPGEQLKYGMILKHIAQKWLLTSVFVKTDKKEGWQGWPVGFLIYVGGDLNEAYIHELQDSIDLHQLTMKVTDNIFATHEYGLYGQLQDEMSNDMFQTTIDQSRHYLVCLNCALMLLNCKNISTNKEHPPVKLNKKRRKNGKQELFTHHTLQLTLPNRRAFPSDGENTSEKSSKRIHFCRGHFKTYTKEKPLMGRHIGRYWWDPSVRGSKERGVVTKDYDVNV